MVIREAQRDDVPPLLEMFAELADYEHLSAIFRATEERLEQALFSERAVAEALIAEREGEAAGYAVYFPTFSSFLASSGIWLEDLFVRPPHRRFGVGRALLSAVPPRPPQRGGGRPGRAGPDRKQLAPGLHPRHRAPPLCPAKKGGPVPPWGFGGGVPSVRTFPLPPPAARREDSSVPALS